MTNNICEKCDKKFTSNYHLKKHLERKNPCDGTKKFTCSICLKNFCSQQSLDRHSNKKISCRKLIVNEVENFNTEKMMILKLKIIEAEKNKELEIMEKKKEIIELQYEKKMSIEKVKTYRKEKTAQIINNTNIQNQTNIINIILPVENVEDATPYNCKIATKKSLLKLDETDAINLVYYTDDIQKLPIEFVTKTYMNEKYPQYRNICYDEKDNIFYMIINGKWQKANLEELIKLIEYPIVKGYHIMKIRSAQYIPKNEQDKIRKIIIDSADKSELSDKYILDVAKTALYYPELNNNYIENNNNAL